MSSIGKKIADLVKSREGKNQYTQGLNRSKVESGYSDCSALTRWAYIRGASVEIGSNTSAQINSKNLKTVDLKITSGVPEETKMLPGDLLFFRGTDKSRKSSQYVGHVETYVGGGQLSGHGSGTGPTRKNMIEYCKQRQSTSSPVPGGNRGLICVRRLKGAMPTDDYKPALVKTKNGGPLNLRPEPNTTSKVIAEIANGTTIEAKAAVKGWHQVKTSKGNGYMSEEYIKMK